ncbi:MAG: NTP transferase domain-containing protein [Henriciella sp.]
MTNPSDQLAPQQTQPWSVFVLAGARASGDALAEAHQVSSKAHIPVAGRSMIGRVLDAVDRSVCAGPVTVIGLENYAALQGAEAWPNMGVVSGENGPAASVSKALAQTKNPYPALITTCDHALLTPEIINDFVNKTNPLDAGMTVALARREDIEKAYPDVARTYLKLGDGAYSSCNLFCLKAPDAAKVVAFWQAAEKDRKKPWKIAWRFGVFTALRLLIGRPPVEDVFRILSNRLGVRVRPVILPYADAAVDVDTLADLALVERVLSERPA